MTQLLAAATTPISQVKPSWRKDYLVRHEYLTARGPTYDLRARRVRAVPFRLSAYVLTHVTLIVKRLEMEVGERVNFLLNELSYLYPLSQLRFSIEPTVNTQTRDEDGY